MGRTRDNSPVSVDLLQIAAQRCLPSPAAPGGKDCQGNIWRGKLFFIFLPSYHTPVFPFFHHWKKSRVQDEIRSNMPAPATHTLLPVEAEAEKRVARQEHGLGHGRLFHSLRARAYDIRVDRCTHLH